MTRTQRCLVGAATMILLIAGASSAEATATYNYRGSPFQRFSCGPSPDQPPATIFCDAPASGNAFTSYFAFDHVTATLALDDPLPPNLPYQSVVTRRGFLLIMADGHRTLSSAGLSPTVLDAHVATNERGEVIAWSLHVPNDAFTSTSGITSIRSPELVVQDNTVAQCCEPFVHEDAALNQNSPGVWNSSLTSCTIQLNGSTFGNGTAIVVTVFNTSNVATTPIPVEAKVWLEAPGFAPIPLINVGADGSVQLPAGTDTNLGPFTLFTVTPQTLRGTYAFSCRLLDPITGKLQSESLQSFVVQ